MTEHNATYVCEAGMIDLYKCSCGWESHPYFDGADYALRAWKRHIEDENKKREEKPKKKEEKPMVDENLPVTRNLLGSLIVGSCDCHTKSNELHLHEPSCLYRRILTAFDEMDYVNELIENLKAYRDWLLQGYDDLKDIVKRQDQNQPTE